MKLKLLTALLLIGVYACSADYSALSYTDRPCGSNLTNLWLDVVAVVDNSLGMTDAGLAIVASNIQSVFSANRIGTDPNEPRTTRLAIVTYNAQATKNIGLNQLQSTDDLYDQIPPVLKTVSNTDQSYLVYGLGAAEDILKQGKKEFNRGHYQQVVIVYASSYNGKGPQAPLPAANRLKTSGVKIITVAFDQKADGSLLEDLEKIASPRFNFTNTGDSVNILGEVQGALLEANCFCPDSWTQYRETYSDYTSFPYGVCIRPVNLNAVWRAARVGCPNIWPNSYLVNEYSVLKHGFVLEAVKATDGFAPPYTYHIGLNLKNGNWTWDQPNGWPQPVVQNWFNWIQGYPIASSSMSSGLNIQNGFGTGWQNEGMYNTGANYVCETYSCDTDNYCDSDGSDN